MIGPSPSTDEVRGYIRNPGVTARNAGAADPPSLDRDTLATPGDKLMLRRLQDITLQRSQEVTLWRSLTIIPRGDALAIRGKGAAAIPGAGAPAIPGGDDPATPGDEFQWS